jgi:hypothetical protein
MTRTMFAMTVAGLIFAAVSGTSQAAPIAPIPAGVANGGSGLTQVYWVHPGWHRRCWRGRWGRLYCR